MASNNRRATPILRTCEACGAEFEHYYNSPIRFCSRYCAGQARRLPGEGQKRYCPSCGRFALAAEDGCCPRCGEAAHREFELVEY